jgi:hypothetical protein
MYIGTKGAEMLPFLLNGVDGMSVKQDRAAPRTVADIERKYNFGKSFAEIMGLIDDTRNEVDSAYSELQSEITEQSTSIRRDTEQIVMQATKSVNESIVGANERIDELTSTVETKMTAEQVSITVQQEIAKGVDRVETSTGYVFDSEGLKINKTGSGMSNTLDNTGMYVERDGVEILTANNEGVSAKDLHAKTFLKIGSGDGRCRFEDYGNTRIGCFWTGG